MTITVTPKGTSAGTGTRTVGSLSFSAGDSVVIGVASDVGVSSYYGVELLDGTTVIRRLTTATYKLANSGNVVAEIFYFSCLTSAEATVIDTIKVYPDTPASDEIAISIYSLTELFWDFNENSSGNTTATLPVGNGTVTRVGNLYYNILPQVWTYNIAKLSKTGSPTGTLYFRVRNFSDDSIVGTFGSIDVSTLTTTPTDYQLLDDVSVTTRGHYYLTVEYSGGNASNYVNVTRVSSLQGGGYPYCIGQRYTGSAWAHDAEIYFYPYNGSGRVRLLYSREQFSGSQGTNAPYDTNITNALSQANEACFAVIAIEEETDQLGAWTTGAGQVSGNEQSTGTTTGGARSISIATAMKVTSATTAQRGTMNAGAPDWSAIILSFREAADTGGAVTIPLDTAIATTTGRSSTIITPRIIVLDVSTITSTGVVSSVVEGAVAILLDTALLISSGQPITVIEGEVSIILDTVAITSLGVSLTVIEGEVTVTLDVAVATCSGVVLTVTSPVLIVLDVATLLVDADDDGTEISVRIGLRYNITHNAGNLSEWSSVVGSISATSASALAGTLYGQAITIDSTNSTRANKSILSSQINTGVLRCRFYVDINSLTMADGIALDIFRVDGSVNGFYFWIYRTGGVYKLGGVVYRSGGSDDIIQPTLPDQPVCIELLLRRESYPGAGNGSFQIWIDDVDWDTIPNLSNYANCKNIWYFQSGDTSPTYPSISGTYYFDELVIRDDDTYIGRLSTIQLDTATTTANGVSSSIEEGQVTRSLNTAISVISGINLIVDAPTGSITIPLGVAIIAGSGQTIIPHKLVMMSTVLISTSGISLTIQEGEAVVLLTVGSIQVVGVSSTLVKGEAIILLGIATISSNGIILSILEGEVILILDVATTLTNGVILSVSSITNIILSTGVLVSGNIAILVVPGESSRILSTSTLVSNGVILTVDSPLAKIIQVSWVELQIPAAVTTSILLSTSIVQAIGPSLSLVPGEVLLVFSNGSISTLGQMLSVAGSAVSISLGLGIILSNGMTLVLVMGEITRALSTAQLSSSSMGFVIIPGERTLQLGLGILLASGKTLDVITEGKILLQTSSISSLGQVLLVIPGEVSILLSVGPITSSGQIIQLLTTTNTLLSTGLVVSQGIMISLVPGEATILLDVVSLLSSGQIIAIIPGEVSLVLQVGSSTLYGQPLSVHNLLGIYVYLTTGIILANGIVLDIRITVDLPECRTFQVLADDRLYLIEEDLRVLEISYDPRILYVDYESRVLNVTDEYRQLKLGVCGDAQ